MELALNPTVASSGVASEPGSPDATAVKALSRLFAAWKIKAEDGASLVGVSSRTWSRMKGGDWNAGFNQDQRMRASGLVGIYKGLHLYFGDTLADKWVRLPNQGAPFSGTTPLAFMLSGGLPAILRVRDQIDALRGGM